MAPCRSDRPHRGQRCRLDPTGRRQANATGGLRVINSHKEHRLAMDMSWLLPIALAFVRGRLTRASSFFFANRRTGERPAMPYLSGGTSISALDVTISPRSSRSFQRRKGRSTNTCRIRAAQRLASRYEIQKAI